MQKVSLRGGRFRQPKEATIRKDSARLQNKNAKCTSTVRHHLGELAGQPGQDRQAYLLVPHLPVPHHHVLLHRHLLAV